MANQIQCPNCGSFATTPIMDGDSSPRAIVKGFSTLLEGVFLGAGVDFNNPKLVQQFQSGEISASCVTCKFRFTVNTSLPNSNGINVKKTNANSQNDLEDRLKKLEGLRAKGLVTESEYKQKKEEILKSL